MSTFPLDSRSDRATTDRVLSVLATELARLVLDYFATSSDETATLDDLTAYVAGRLDQSSAESRAEVQTRLHHVSLPKLSNAGLVDYDARTAVIRYRGPALREDWRDLFAEEVATWSG